MMVALLLATLAGAPDPRVLAPAERGEMQCYAPDAERKTCRALAGYVKQADGSYLNTARVLLHPARNIVLETATIVEVVGDAVCGRVKRADAFAGTLFIDGEIQSPDAAAPMLNAINDAQASAGMIGPLICTRYPAEGGALMAKISVDGVYRPEFDDKVIWVRPDQGYRVAH